MKYTLRVEAVLIIVKLPYLKIYRNFIAPLFDIKVAPIGDSRHTVVSITPYF